ncbi:UDP-glucose dehydrogenase family protein [Anaeromyxobacter paludicola]|uniref:UDP-glucose 6-dehydrogenase n=1 Tax=Anaeromyxobacter paludicola TaxID=2918171 RepID=A0ABN6N3F1_9BACT|nr:UDP-glucose/GDP-mannose dehydrogenase family protein [Anaeromyxobacter paludicola]BDG07486.1 UDP-glucose 6-dehydrogenase [Anaeromyxobacter paludicola]
MRIAVIGTGYVGLVAGACLADSGNEVVCVDADARKVRALADGRVPIFEPGLEELVRKNGAAGRLSFTSDVAAAAEAEVVFLAVGTPEGEDGSADLAHVLEAAEGLARVREGYTLVAVKSTVPVGTGERIRRVMLQVNPGLDLDVASNPEFMKEGAAVADFQKPDRVVIGTLSERARALLGELYAPFVRTEKPILFMDPRSAELTKYAANAMLATRISFMNDIALLCERTGADVDLVRKGMGADARIGYSFLFPGVGYGGSCFPKDVKALIATGREGGLDLEILKAVERTNLRQKRALVQKAVRHFGALEGLLAAVWGLAFKPRTDDMREAPAIEVMEGLLGKGAQVRCHDPVAEPAARRWFHDRVEYARSIYDCVEGADALFVVTEWNQFRKPDLRKVKRLMRHPVIFDGRNVFDPARMRELGFAYYAIGRP